MSSEAKGSGGPTEAVRALDASAAPRATPSDARRRLVLAAPPVLGVLVVVLFAYFGLGALDRVSHQAQRIVDSNLENTVRISEIASNTRALNGEVYRLMTLRAANTQGIDFTVEFGRLGAQVDDLIGELRKFHDTQVTSSQADAINDAVKELENYRQALEFVGSMLDLDFASAVGFIQPFNGLFDTLATLLSQMTQSTVLDAQRLSNAATASTQQIGRWFLVVAALVATGVAMFGWITGKRQERFVFSTTILEREVADRTAALQAAKQQAEAALQEVKRTQTQLVEAEKMAALGSLVAGVAHEINTPVGTSLTAATLLEDRTREFRALVDANQIKRADLSRYLTLAAETTGLMLTNIHRATELIQSFKQVAVDQTSAERRSFDLADYIDEVLMSLRPNLRKASAQVNVECLPGIEMNSFPGVFAQVLTNLVMNALIHAFDGRTTGTITVTGVPVGESVQLQVRDNGKGIDPANLARIFDPFFTTRRGSGGTGLGLHIVYNIITQQLGGSIQVSSEREVGTVFSMLLPKAAPVAAPVAVPV